MSSDIFNCVNCGDCCKGYGGTYVTPADIKAIAAFIKIDPTDFVDKYCNISGKKPVLAQGDNGYCIFWDINCAIHPVKPRMCRDWPFIKNVLADIKNWHIMASVCPGIRTDIPDEIIKKRVIKELSKNSTYGI